MGLFDDIIKSSNADAGDLAKAAQHYFANQNAYLIITKKCDYVYIQFGFK